MSTTRFPCPACDGTLTARNTAPDAWLFCEANGGVAIRNGALRKKFGEETTDRLWSLVDQAPESAGRDCPRCSSAMTTFWVTDLRTGLIVATQPDLELDACAACRLVWFDRMELNEAQFITHQPSHAGILFTIGLAGWPGLMMLRWAEQQRRSPAAIAAARARRRAQISSN